MGSPSLADALKERERRAKERDGLLAASTPSASGLYPSAAGGAGGGAGGGGAGAAGGASGKSHDLMPVAPMMAAGGAGGGMVAPMTAFSGPTPIDLSDLRRFITTPTPRSAGMVQCYIERDKSGLTGRMYPTYSLYLNDGNRFLLAARKRTNNKTSNYAITQDKRDLSRESAAFVGKLRSNFVGTEFVLYDDGVAPEKRADGGEIRQELAAITYASNVLGSRGPRKMKAAVPKIAPDGRRVVFQPERCVAAPCTAGGEGGGRCCTPPVCCAGVHCAGTRTV